MALLTVMLCMLFAVVATLFNIAPITYMVFGIAIVLGVLQYGRFKKRTISERAYNRLACGLFVVITLCISWLVADWLKYDTQTTRDQTDGLSLVQWIGNVVGLIVMNYQKD